jgi:hypothetical protein
MLDLRTGTAAKTAMRSTGLRKRVAGSTIRIIPSQRAQYYQAVELWAAVHRPIPEKTADFCWKRLKMELYFTQFGKQDGERTW